MGARFTRITIVANERRLDVSLPADVALTEQFPTILRLLSIPSTRGPVRWALSSPESGPLNVHRTLDELGVLDGRMLHLTPAEAAAQPPWVDDVESAVAETVAEIAPRWDGEPRRAGVVRMLAVILGVGWWLVLLDRAQPGAGWGALAIAVVALVVGGLARQRAGWWAISWAVPAYALLGVLVPLPDQAQPGGLLVGAALGLLQIGIVRRSALCVSAGIVTVLLSCVGLALLSAGVVSGLVAGVTLVVALALASLAGQSGLSASRLVALFISDERGARVRRAEVVDTVRRGYEVTTGWLAGCSAVAAVAVAVMLVFAEGPRQYPELSRLVAAAGGWGALAFALRSRRFSRATQVWPMLAVGLVGALSAAVRIPDWVRLSPSAALVAELFVLGLVLIVTAGLGFAELGAVAGARAHRILDVIEPLMIAVLVPGVAMSFGLLPAVIAWVS